MKSLFGVHLTSTQTIYVTATPLSSGAPMYYAARVDNKAPSWITRESSGTNWGFELNAGDYMFRLEDSSTNGPVSIECVTGDITLVTIPLSGTPAIVNGTQGQSKAVLTANPKDPWPPPPPPPYPGLPTESYNWFVDYLLPYSGTVSRSADAEADQRIVAGG